MRDIRFRVWEKPQEGFEGKLWTDNDPNFWASCLMNEKDEYELSQYTGLKDKNGVLIYEGDIVKNEWGTFEIKWVQGGFKPMNFEAKDGLAQIVEWRDEIIGNVYENKDLL